MTRFWNSVRGRLLLAAGVILILLFALGAWIYKEFERPFGEPGRFVWVTIPNGESSDAIGAALQRQGVVGSALWFHLYLLWTRQSADLQAGRYRFASGMTLPQVVAELRQGAARFNTVQVTIPEGFTVQQIATLLAYDHVCTQKAFYAQVRHGVFPYPFLRKLPSNKAIRDRLEGYLFPDTYDFLRGESPHEVISTMLGEMNRVLTPKRLALMKKDGLTISQTLTIASMIEREAKLNSERPLIASVILNRWRHQPPMRLRIDATVEYAVGFTQNLTLRDLQVNSPYNTYIHYGLPPGPIANPGLLSIEAVLRPAHTDYYFYVARNDGSGGHYFARTFAQQLANEARSTANLQRLEKAHS